MQEHIAYWKELICKKLYSSSGPGVDPKEIYSLTIVEAANEGVVDE
jgi:hypothetical protein